MEEFEKKKKLVYDLLCEDFYVPMKAKELAVFMNVPKEARGELQKILEELVAEGKAEVTAKGKFVKGSAKGLIGVYTCNAKGFGFVSVEGEPEDYFIPEGQEGGAFYQDTVQIAVITDKPSEGKRKEARVVKIISHGITELVGTYEASKNFGFVVPDNPKITSDIFIPIEYTKNATRGQKVVVTLTDYGDGNKNPEGKIREIIGDMDEPGVDILSIAKAYDLPMDFPEKVQNQANRIPEEILKADEAGRKNLCDWQMITIDGEDAKDLDDAVSCVMEGDCYRLGVHIADVSNYVQEHSALDEEAKKRGTSVYLVDRVIPMLPKRLSNGICSLNEKEKRLALSCIMLFDAKGKMIDHEIAETVICVDHRMTYTSVKKMLVDKDEAECQKYEDILPMLTRMEKLSALLRGRRTKRGAIDFDFPETKILLNEKGEPVEIKPYERNVATKMIEDFMLAANETVAEDYFWQEIPFLYRTHEVPDPEKMQKLSAFAARFGYTLRTNKEEMHPKELQKLLSSVKDTPAESLIAELLLRSMKQAKYTVENSGHFGLAAAYYCHFTSPIRRYPDLQIHRIIKDNLRGRLKEGKLSHYEKILPEVAKHSCETERRADEAERETEKLKKVQYMEGHLGEVFEGVISGVTSWGFYVALPNTVEGLVHVTSLKDDYYKLSEETYELIGEVTNKHYKLGQKVKVMVEATNRMLRTIDFVLAEENDE